jgi:hypothetical protein
MLEFINNNGVLFSGIFSIVGALIAAVVAVVKENKANRKDTIASLHKKVAELKSQLATTEVKLQDALSIEKAESLIDKTKGSIYYESFNNGGSRPICGFCWEKEHIKIPLNVNICYDEYTKEQYYSGRCSSCNCFCIENIENIPPDESKDTYEDLPF